MKVSAIFESGSTQVLLDAESDDERRMLGVLGTAAEATVNIRHEGHFSYGKASAVSITLIPASPPAVKRPEDFA